MSSAMNVQTGAGDSGRARDDRQPDLQAGLLGRGIEASRSPAMHKAEGAALGLRYHYHLYDFDRLGLSDSALPDRVAKACREGFSGLNVTYPFKERIIPFLHSLSPAASAIGAVNTVVFRSGLAVGHNTDCWGFAESFRRGLARPRLDAVVLVGAGGAGMAVAKALLDLGADRLIIFDTNRVKAAGLSERLRTQCESQRIVQAADLREAVADASGLVNATPVGMVKFPGMPVERDWLRPDLWVADIVYFPAETELLRAAKATGCQTLPGAGMAIFQAVRAFELITGVKPDPERMTRHFQAG